MLTMIRLRYQVIPSIDGQSILETDWTRATPGHTQTSVVILDDTFPW